VAQQLVRFVSTVSPCAHHRHLPSATGHLLPLAPTPAGCRRLLARSGIAACPPLSCLLPNARSCSHSRCQHALLAASARSLLPARAPAAPPLSCLPLSLAHPLQLAALSLRLQPMPCGLRLQSTACHSRPPQCVLLACSHGPWLMLTARSFSPSFIVLRHCGACAPCHCHPRVPCPPTTACSARLQTATACPPVPLPLPPCCWPCMQLVRQQPCAAAASALLAGAPLLPLPPCSCLPLPCSPPPPSSCPPLLCLSPLSTLTRHCAPHPILPWYWGWNHIVDICIYIQCNLLS
jgi:hypothetical protein